MNSFIGSLYCTSIPHTPGSEPGLPLDKGSIGAPRAVESPGKVVFLATTGRWVPDIVEWLHLIVGGALWG